MILLRTRKVLKSGVVIAKHLKNCMRIYPELNNKSVYWEMLCFLETINMAICLRCFRLRIYRVYLKYLDKLPERVPHTKRRKNFISIYVRKHSFRGRAMLAEPEPFRFLSVGDTSPTHFLMPFEPFATAPGPWKVCEDPWSDVSVHAGEGRFEHLLWILTW